MTAPSSPEPTDFDALLDFYVGAGVDCALEDAPVDRFAETERAAHARNEQARAQAAAMTARLHPERQHPGHQHPGHQHPGHQHPGHQNHPVPPQPPAQPAGQSAAYSHEQQPRPAAERQGFAAPQQPAPAYGAAGGGGVGGGAALPGDGEVENARARAASAQTLDELREILASFEGCNLKRTAKNTVFSDGSANARVMLVGEAPGRDEDIQGLPFVGRSGQLLDRMLAAIGLDRTSVYIANIVPWRPPGNRTPTPQEAEICKPFIRRQIELVDPDVLVFLGGASAKALTGASEGILKLRGRWMDFDTGRRTIRAIATLHPAYLLRTPTQKRLAWQDLLAIRAVLDEGQGS